MNLCAIYNVWDDYELLELSIDNILPVVDGVIIIWSEKSNYGEVSKSKIDHYKYYRRGIPFTNKYINSFNREPQFHYPSHSETDKRNHGLSIAKDRFTHFITMDADEFYLPEDIENAKKLFDDPELQGLVCRSQVYFGSPKLTIGLDTTLVPFIHKITPNLKHEFNKNYPFAWEGKSIRIDPTRSLNINSGVKM